MKMMMNRHHRIHPHHQKMKMMKVMKPTRKMIPQEMMDPEINLTIKLGKKGQATAQMRAMGINIGLSVGPQQGTEGETRNGIMTSTGI